MFERELRGALLKNWSILSLMSHKEMTLDTHIYFVPTLHLHQSLIKSESWVQMGECTVHVRPSVDKDLYAVILVALEATPCLERRQALKAVANEDASPSILRLSDPVKGSRRSRREARERERNGVRLLKIDSLSG